MEKFTMGKKKLFQDAYSFIMVLTKESRFNDL